MSEAITVNGFRSRMALHMATGAAILPVHSMAFGTGGHDIDEEALPPDVTATGLNNQVLIKALNSITQVDEFSVTAKGSIEADEANGFAISEAGLFDIEGNLIGIKNFSPKHKDSGERYEISIKLRF